MIAALAAASTAGAAPAVVISEFMAENNALYYDAFGNASDWLELQNTTPAPVSLEGWSLTDNLSQPRKWVLPALTLPPWGTRLIWASNADLRDPAGELHTNFALSKSGEYLGLYDASGTLVHHYGTKFPAQYENIAYGYALEFTTNTALLVSNTAPVRAFCPADNALGTLWRARDFDDTSWTNGHLPVGYATKTPAPAFLEEVNMSLQPLAYGRPGVYLRIPFLLPGAAAVQSLSFETTYDDGAAAFVNAAFACGPNAPAVETLSYASYAASILGNPSTLEPTDISHVSPALADGTNILAVHLLNGNASSSDLFLKATLSATLRSLTLTDEPAFLFAATPGTLNGGPSLQRLPQTVAFSVPSGITTTNLSLSLSGSLPGQTIRYTTDGSDPTPATGLPYSEPLTVTASAHLRARVFDAAGRSGETATAHYTFASNDPATLSFSTSLPILILTAADPLRDGIPTAESTNYTACGYHLVEPVAGSACLTSAPALSGRAGIHVRGSSSSTFPKKPYALTFWGEDNDDRKVDLKGFPKGSDFALIGCWNYDRTYLHDPLMFDLSRQMGRYAPRTRHVEVFFIGRTTTPLLATNYYGLFVLEERVKADSDRVPIDDTVSPSDTALPALSGSYLFKADRNDADEFYWRTARNFPNSSGRYMVLASPKLDAVQPEQSRYLVDAFNAFEDAAYGADPMHPETGVARHIDVGSWIDFHILKMYSMDVDIFTLSSWFHKDRGGKIMAGPVWDFDRSLGPYGYAEATYPNVRRWDAWTFASEPFTRPDFWGRLHAQPHFRRLYWDRWFELRQSVFSATNLAATVARLKAPLPDAAAHRDYTRWNMWPTNDAFGRTHSGEVSWMTWFATNHAAWIDQNHAAKSSLLKAPTLSPGSRTLPAGALVRVTLSAPEGDSVRYTLDGTDPALWNGQPSSVAHTCAPGTVLTLTQPALLCARAYRSSDSRWGLAARAEYLIGARRAQPGDIQLSEVHYNPALDRSVANPLPEQSARHYEFVELLNVADLPVSLTGCRFPDGQPADALTLGPLLLQPGTHAVIARHPEAFRTRYADAPSPAAHWLYGALSDSGETLTLLSADGLVLDTLDYKTGGTWPKSADGRGDSLNRAAFGLAPRTPWKAAPPTPGRGGYWEWSGLRGLSDPDSDDDGDGAANLLEYYTGADPLDPSDRGLSNMQGTASEQGLHVWFHQAADRPDAQAALQYSDDLLEWFDLDPSALASEDTGNGLLWSLRLTPDEVALHPSRFFRLSVSPAAASASSGLLPPPLP